MRCFLRPPLSPLASLSLKYTLVTTAVFCLWLMWGILYMAQMNPLILPVLNAD